MADRPPLDLLIKNVRLVQPGHHTVESRDLGIADGRFTRVEPAIDAALAREVFDARGQLGFPGVVDAHTHVGIYAPLRDDAVTESQAAVTGGVTTGLTYFRTGGHGRQGRADQDAQRRFLMVGEDESYDLAPFEFIMRAASRIRRAHPALAPHVSVSLHCEIADILNAYTQRVARDGSLVGRSASGSSARVTWPPATTPTSRCSIPRGASRCGRPSRRPARATRPSRDRSSPGA
jgi:hypothetical protein